MPPIRESEAKFSVPSDLRLPRSWGIDGLTTRPGRRMRLTTLYHDTRDLRLARWGASLRYRAGEGWTVKLPESASEGLIVRAEHRFAGRPDSPPAGALDLVRAYVRRAPVEPVTRMRTRRTSFSFVDHTGREVAELVDDRVVAEGPAVTDPDFREVEVELRDGAPAGLADSVAGRLAAAERHVRPKLVRALGPPAEAPPDVVVPETGAEATAGHIVRAAIASAVVRLLQHDPGARLGSDPESVHQCRVAVRRLRSDLRTLAPLLDAEWIKALRDELRWLGDSLGNVRDADVLLEGFRRRASTLPDGLKRPAERLLRRLAAEGEEHRRAMLADLRGERYALLLDRLVEAAKRPALLPGAAEPASSSIPPLSADPWHRLRSTAEDLPEEPTDEDLHRLRIRVKRARYAAEAVQMIGGRPVARFARAASRLQDVLGIHQDAVVATEWLRGKAARASGPIAFAAGALAAACWNEAAEARGDLPKAWKRLAKRVPEGWA